MKENGRIGHIMVKGHMLGLKEIVMKEDGRTVSFMVKEY